MCSNTWARCFTEKSGLTNEELDLCQILMTIPGNPDYFSLNVASAIQVFAYQNYVYATTTKFDASSNELASFNVLESFYKHLAQVLEHIDYFEEAMLAQVIHTPQHLIAHHLHHWLWQLLQRRGSLLVGKAYFNSSIIACSAALSTSETKSLAALFSIVKISI
jgi:hypothetical protein